MARSKATTKRLLAALLLADAAFAQENPFQFNGFVDSYHAVQAEHPHDFTSSRTRLRAEMRADRGDARLFASLNATHDGVLDDRSGVRLREAYFDYGNDIVEFRAGRQIVVWGVADGLRVTDLVSPVDYSEFMSNDYDDMRMAVDGLRLRYAGARANAELVYVPVPRYFRMPLEEGNPWRPDLPEKAGLDFPEGPDAGFGNGDFGTRVSFFLPGLDFSVSALRTRNQAPVSVVEPAGADSVAIRGVHRAMTMVGGDVSMPVGEFVIRAEAAEYLGEALGVADGRDWTRRNTFNALGGIDWYAGGGWTFMAQYLHKYVAGDSRGLAVGRNSSETTFRVSKEMLNDALKLSLYGMFDVDDRGYYARASGDYAVADQVTLSLGYDRFGGERGQLAGYSRNSGIWFRARCFF